MNTSLCGSLPTMPETGTWFRAIQPHFLLTALATSHTSTVASRYNPGSLGVAPFDILYLAENHLVALFEVQALLGSPYIPGGIVPHPRRPWTILNVYVTLHNTIDLTAPASQKLLSTTAQELTGDWRGYQLRGPSTSVPGPTGIAPTQNLGAAISALSNVEGIRTLSAKLPDQQTLIVFPKNLQPGSSIKFSDPMTQQTHSIP